MSYSDEVLDDSPVGYWKLNESTLTSTFADSSGTGANLTTSVVTAANVSGLISCESPTAWDSTNSAGTLAHASVPAALRPTAALTLEGLWKPGWPATEGDGTYHHTFIWYGNQDSAPFGAYGLLGNTAPGLNANRKDVQFHLTLGGVAADLIADEAIQTPDLKTYYVAAVYNGSTMKLYLAEIPSGSVTEIASQSASGSISNYDTGLGIMNEQDGGHPGHAVYQHLAVYNYALSIAQMTRHFDAAACALRRCSLNASDEVLFVDATSNSITVDLFPDEPLVTGPIRYIKRIDGSSHTVTIDPGSTTIDRQDSMILMPRDALAVITDGQEWWTV